MVYLSENGNSLIRTVLLELGKTAYVMLQAQESLIQR